MSTDDYGRWTDKPIRYPYGEASSIHDAGAFRIGDRDTVHQVHRFRFRDGYGHVVTAACGAYGYDATETRAATWAGVWDDADQCPRCFQ